jgi:plastocyanin
LEVPVRGCVITLLVSCCLATPAAAPAVSVALHGLARVASHPQANVVVWLEGGGAGAEAAAQPVLDQRNLQFWPQVLAVRVGTTVKFPNSDRVFHNVFSFRDGKQFDLGLYPVGAVKHVRFDRPGVSRLFCNIHPKMAAYVVAVDSPYFAMSDERGAFTIDVPPGGYKYTAWRAGGPLVNGTIQVTPNGAMLEVDWR